MKTLVKLRNIEAHNYDTSTFYLVAEKSLEILNKVIECIEKPRKTHDICIKASNILTCDVNDSVLDVVTKMITKDFSYVPVMENNSFCGVFSSNVLMHYFMDNSEAILGGSIKMSYLRDYLPMNKHIGEAFEFVSRDSLLADVETKLYKSYDTSKRLEAVFITENGNKNSNEKIIGMITYWDIFNLYFEEL